MSDGDSPLPSSAARALEAATVRAESARRERSTSRKVAVVYYPEGMGHATRMLAVGRAIETEGFDVSLAGSGPGTRFVRRNGYRVFEPTSVEFIRDYQYRLPINALLRSVPHGGKRTAELANWLRRERPAALVTDDMFAAMAALFTATPLYVVSHNSVSLYEDPLDRFFTGLINRYQQTVGRAFFYPAVWEPFDDDPRRAMRIGPLAFDPPTSVDPPETDALLVPSEFSSGFDALAERLREADHRTTLVGDAEWVTAPTLLPWIRAADVVVCSGYSTVMEAAVGGTPCVVYPFTDEQHGVCRKLRRSDADGFRVARSPSDVSRAVEAPPDAPRYANGADAVANAVAADLR